MPVVFTKGTLAEYDMVLGISQEAVNLQLKQLYWCVPDKDNAPNDYLVDHVMKIGYIESPNPFNPKVNVMGDGITAWIGPPKVDFDASIPEADPNRSMRFTIPMYAGWADLTVSGQKGRLFFNDWTVSWVCNIGRRDIQKLEEEAISPEAKAQIHDALGQKPDGTKKDDSKIDPKLFLISSLFCLFEHVQIVNSFDVGTGPKWKSGGTMATFDRSITDPECPLTKPATSAGLGDLFVDSPADQTSLIQTFKDNILDYYTGKDKDHPKKRYILGYTIEQKPGTKIPDAMFQPKSFVLTISPQKNEKQSLLNFCMLDGSHSDEETKRITGDKNNGVYTDSFVSLTKSPTDTSGIMATSEQMFCRAFIRQLVDVMTVSSNGGVSPVDSIDKSTYSRVLTFSQPPVKGDLVIVEFEADFTVTNTVDAKWSSTLRDSNDPSSNWKPDATRELTVEINGNYHLDVSTKVKYPLFDWVDGGNSWHDLPYNIALRLTSGKDGKWAFVPDLAHQTINMPKRDEAGRYPFKSDHHYKGLNVLYQKVDDLINGDTSQKIADMFSMMVLSPDWTDHVSAALTCTASRVILPAGDVFEFYGLDTDQEGNIYSHLTYKSLTNGSRTAA